MDNIRPHLEATVSQQAAQRTSLKKALGDSRRESDALVTLKLREQVDEETFERRRLALLDQQAKLQLQADQPTVPPEALLTQVQQVLNFSASLPHAFREGDAVSRRQLFRAVCANPTVRDRKALYKAKEPFSFFVGSGPPNSWCSVVERLRTWNIEQHFQIAPIFVEVDEVLERSRRAGVPKRSTTARNVQAA